VCHFAAPAQHVVGGGRSLADAHAAAAQQCKLLAQPAPKLASRAAGPQGCSGLKRALDVSGRRLTRPSRRLRRAQSRPSRTCGITSMCPVSAPGCGPSRSAGPPSSCLLEAAAIMGGVSLCCCFMQGRRVAPAWCKLCACMAPHESPALSACLSKLVRAAWTGWPALGCARALCKLASSLQNALYSQRMFSTGYAVLLMQHVSPLIVPPSFYLGMCLL